MPVEGEVLLLLQCLGHFDLLILASNSCTHRCSRPKPVRQNPFPRTGWRDRNHGWHFAACRSTTL